MKTTHLLGIAAMFTIACSTMFAASLFAADDKVVATVKEEPIRASEVAAHMEAGKLTRDEALNDLIDQKQMRIVAAEKGIKVPSGTWSAEQRARVDADFVKALSLPLPNYVGDAVVDHAYVKLEQKDGLALMERLRALVEKGATIPAAFNELQVDGTNWHIGDHEEYPVPALPDETREIPDGGLTKIIAGNEGYNLFKIYERKIPADEVRRAVSIYLIEHTFDLVNVVEE